MCRLPIRLSSLLLAMSAQHVRQFLGADVWRHVPEGAGLRSGVGWELVRVRRVRPDLLDFPGADVRRDVLHCIRDVRPDGCELLRVRVRPGAAVPLRHQVG